MTTASDSFTAIRPRAAWPFALVCLGFVACAIGLFAHDLYAALVHARLRETLLLMLLAMLAAWPLRRLAGWSWASAVAVIGGLALSFFVGALAILATALLAACSYALGDMLLPKPLPGRPAIATAVGLAVIGAVLGWVLPLPIHRWYVYLPLFSAVIIWRWRALHEFAHASTGQWKRAVAEAPGPAFFALLLLLLASAGCWLPTMQSDDIGYHLSLPTQLLQDGRYDLDPTHQVWALAPWLGDVLQGIVQVLARGEGRGALNALWLALAAAGLWSCAAGLGLTGRGRWWTIALFASLPSMLMLTAGMQTELAATALMLSLAAVLVNRAPDAVWAAALLLGALLGLKLGHALAALPVMIYAIWQWRTMVSGKRWLLAAALVLLAGGSSYTYAGYVSGNPVLPLFNEFFRSPYFPLRNFDDLRWHTGFGPDLLWNITFDTGHYLEAYDGGFGFALVALAGAWLLALVRPATRAYAWMATFTLLLPMFAIQYARYAIPGMVLLLPALVAAICGTMAVRAWQWLLIALCTLNLAFHTHGQWLLYSGAVKKIVRSLDDEAALLRIYVPERLLIERARHIEPEGVVLATDPDRPFTAAAGTLGRRTNWYAPEMEAARLAAQADSSGERWRKLFADHAVRWVLVSRTTGTPLRRGLANEGARRVAVEDGIELWRLPAREAQP